MEETNKIRLEIVSDRAMPGVAPCYLLYKDSYCKYSIQCDALSSSEREVIMNTTVCLEDYMKPIRKIGSYTVDKLLEMAKTLNVLPDSTDGSVKYKKQDMYERVANKMVWNSERPNKRRM